MKQLPPDLYKTFDPAVVRLCRLLNTEFPGLQTTGSCQGFVDDHRPGESWVITIRLDRRQRKIAESVASIELLTWMINSDLARCPQGCGVRVGLNSAPPYLNHEPLYFYLEGQAGQAAHPDQVAESIEFYLRKLQEVT